MQTHTIVPLVISKVVAEKGSMTYLTYHGERIIRPYVMWFIRAGNTNVLVDTAIEAEDYRNYHPCFNKLPFEKVQGFEEALHKVDCAPEDIDIIIQTHLHMDHVYNTPKCKNAKILVQEEELKFALAPHPVFDILFPSEIIQSLKFEVLKGSEEILSGINVMLVPGHTPGCQAVVVETEQGRAVITGCCTIMENFTPTKDIKTKGSPFATYPVIAPGIHTDLFQSYESALKIKEVADIIIPVHDPTIAKMAEIPYRYRSGGK
ncbi:MAG: N-acyl homoserine lactonase family protein [Deltaproteobacteria bacterium]|nr:MAG: N-acyl homoserine lactonase family protein [Deltaproteobacteria bacterium]